MPIEIEKVYVFPRAAFEIVGQESYGTEWKSDFVDKPNSAEHKLCLDNLKNALLSGVVDVSYTYDDGLPRNLNPRIILAKYFRIDLKADLIREEQTMPDGARCDIHADQLRKFFKLQAVALIETKSNNRNEVKFKKYLLDRTDEEIFSARKSGMRAIAISEYKIGIRAFLRCWKALVAERPVHSKGGRPRNPVQ